MAQQRFPATYHTVEDLLLHLPITLVQIYTWIFLSQTNINQTNQSNTVFLYYLIQVWLFLRACWKISTRQKRTTNKLSVHVRPIFPPSLTYANTLQRKPTVRTRFMKIWKQKLLWIACFPLQISKANLTFRVLCVQSKDITLWDLNIELISKRVR